MGSIRSHFRAVVERLLPWYDPDAAREAEAHSEEIRLRSIRARIESEQIRRDYTAMARRLQR